MDTGSPCIAQILYSRHLPAARRGTVAHSPPSWSAHGYAFDDTAFSPPLERKKAEVQFLHLRSVLILYMKKALFRRSGRTNKTALQILLFFFRKNLCFLPDFFSTCPCWDSPRRNTWAKSRFESPKSFRIHDLHLWFERRNPGLKKSGKR